MPKNNDRFQPVESSDVPRFAGIASFMRLPLLDIADAADADIGLYGIPWDGGTTNRAGARHGPRQIRDQSCLMRKYHPALGISPYQLANCADLGDAPCNPINIDQSLKSIEQFVTQMVKADILPLGAGGDHLASLPVLRALHCKHGPMGMVHFDAHTDTWDRYFGGNRYTHGTPFRRAIEEGLLDPQRIVQIGIRGGLYSAEDDDWGLAQGIRIIRIEECLELGVDRIIEESRRIVGDTPTYLSFDIDCLDPVFAPGTGTPEIGGVQVIEAQLMLRGLRGLNLIGADMVEVSPPFDPSGNTALVGATLMWEMLCLLAELVDQRG